MPTKSTLSALIETALEVLEDPTPLHQKTMWYRNGTRGNVHFDRNCYKFEGTYSGGQSFEATLVEIAAKKQCTMCCDSNVLPASLRRPLSAAYRAKVTLVAAGDRETSGKIASIGVGLGEVASARHELNVLTETEIDLCAAAHERLSSELAALESRLREALNGYKKSMVGWSSARLMFRRRGASGQEVPGSDPADVALYGMDHSSVPTLQMMYRAWVRHRRKSAAEAAEAADKLVETARLAKIDQLRFEPTGLTFEPGENVLTAVNRVWRTELRSRLHEQIIPQWETLWSDLSGRTEPALIGIGATCSNEETHAVLGVYPNRVTADGRERVLLAPLVVCQWVEAVEKRWNFSPEIAPGCSEEELEVVAALWEPRTEKSAYKTLTAAHTAAVNLSVS